MCSSLTLISSNPLSGQFIVTCLIISSKDWLNSSYRIGQIPYVLAWRYSRAWSKSCFSFSTSSLDAFEWETYCIKLLLFSSFQSRGGIILLSTSKLYKRHLRDWAWDQALFDCFLLSCITRHFRIFRFQLRTWLKRKGHLHEITITIFILHRHRFESICYK